MTLAQQEGYNFNKWCNKALTTFEHDLQTNHNVKDITYWLTESSGNYVGYREDGQGSVPKMLRIQTHLLDYLRMNNYKVNTALNYALQRWCDYKEKGQVADYVITDLRKRGKY